MHWCSLSHGLVERLPHRLVAIYGGGWDKGRDDEGVGVRRSGRGEHGPKNLVRVQSGEGAPTSLSG